MSDRPTPEQVLACPMGNNDAGAAIVRDYLVRLLHLVWEEEEGFNGKRPFGNSGWPWEVYTALAKAGLIEATFDDQGYVTDFDSGTADELVLAAIDSLE